jgi:cold shock CspA family protein
MDKLKGEVRVLNVKRGFGFIAGSDRRDFFFHFNNVLKGTI